jgi:NADH-quinone oxidoreductase subunit N
MTEAFLIFSSIPSELILSIGAIFLLILGVIKKEPSKVIIYIGILFLLLALISLKPIFDNGQLLVFNQSLVINDYVSFVQGIIIVATILSLLLTASYSNINRIFLRPEFTVLIIFSVVGMLIMVSANDFLSLYLGLELQSLCLYILASFDRDNLFSSESGLKYFILGALASGILLYGISLIYGFSGTINFMQFSFLYNNYTASQIIPIGVLIGMVMVVIALSFKIAAVPFHMWIPDVYQGSPLPVTAFFAIVTKIAPIVVLAKLLLLHFDIWVDSWLQIITLISIVSMIVGALGALRQKNFKRLLAYSTIGHVGYMLIGVATQNESGLEALSLYMIVYALLSAGVFGLIMMLQNKRGKENSDLNILSGLAKNHPIIAASLATLMLSMAGIPPFAGFIVKFYIFMAAIEANLYLLPIVGVITSIVATYYYLRIIKIMYFEDTAIKPLIKEYYFEVVIVVISVVTLNMVFFLIPAKFNSMIFAYIASMVR